MPCDVATSKRNRKSWVFGISIPWAARTALVDFSTDCWAWNPTTVSAARCSPVRIRAASRSSPPFRRKSLARSRLSGLGNDAALVKCGPHERALHPSPLVGLLLAHDDHVHRDPERRQGIPQADHLLSPVGDIAFDDEEVEIAGV